MGCYARSDRGLCKTAETDCCFFNRKSEISNILVGDVILHARQTSIDISLGRNEDGQQAAAAMKPNPMFRAISIKAFPSAEPLHDLAKEATTGWTVVIKVAPRNTLQDPRYPAAGCNATLDCLRTAATCLSRCDLSASHRDRQAQTGLGCRESHNRQGCPLILKPLLTQLTGSNQILWT